MADGLPRDVEELRRGAGDDDLWAQEFELKWLDEASAWLTFELITGCEHDMAGQPEHYQGGPCFVGVDIAARNDLFVIWVFEQVGDVLWTREIIERRRITFAEQDMLLDDVFARYRVIRCCMDQTGMGEKPVEDARARHGSSRVQGVLFISTLLVLLVGFALLPPRRLPALTGLMALQGGLASLALGWQALLNTRGTTWRKLDESLRNSIDNADAAAALMLEMPAIIKRPLLCAPGRPMLLGFSEASYQQFNEV